MNVPPIDPINPQQTDAAAGSVFAGERRGFTRWTPKLPGARWTLFEALIVTPILIGLAIVIALWVF